MEDQKKPTQGESRSAALKGSPAFRSQAEMTAARTKLLTERNASGRRIAESVQGTKQQKTKLLMRSEISRKAVLEFGNRKQKRAAQRASAKLEKQGKLVRSDDPAR